MKRTTGAIVLLAGLAGGVATEARSDGTFMGSYWTKEAPDGAHWGAHSAPSVPGLQGPWGAPVPMAAPYSVNPPSGEAAARAMFQQSMPLDLVQQAGFSPSIPMGSGVVQATTHPPGVGSPISGPPGAVAAVGALTGQMGAPQAAHRTEVRFVGPAGMQISWYSPQGAGRGGFSGQFLEAPARYNFLQAAIYRLKISNIPNRAGLVLYPTLEVVPAKAKTATFLAHSAVPVSFTDEDFEQVANGNFVVKVIYLPDPQFQDLAAVGPDEVVSSRLEPGVDPIHEAQRRGSILLVVRLGNIDLEAPNTPAMDAPSPFQQHAAMPPQGMMPGAGAMNPYGAMANGQQLPPGMMPPGMMPPGMMPPGMMPPGMMPGMAPQGTQPRIPAALPTSNPTPNAVPAPQTSPVGQAPAASQVQPVRYTLPNAGRPTPAELASPGSYK
jgi:hypothetical protein